MGEPVFVAATASEADRVARVLEDAGVPYSERLDAALDDPSSRICYLGTVFEVSSEVADKCRQLLKERGFTPEPSPPPRGGEGAAGG